MAATGNTLLDGLGAADRAALDAHTREVELKLGDVVATPGDRVERVVWVGSGLLSIVASSEDGQSVETSMIGREGASGLLESCGSRTSFLTVLVQVEGRGWSTPPQVCRDLFESSPTFRQAVLRYTESMIAEGRQSVVCQSSHSVEERCARWLLESRDRSGCGDRIPLTQEYLAAMLGVQRTTVTGVASSLQRRGLIKYSRGLIELLDPESLEAVTCSCRPALQEHRTRVLQQ